MMMIGLICLIPSTLLAYLSPSIGAKIKRFGERKSFLTASILAILLLIWMSASTVPVLFGLGWSGYSFAVTAMNLSMDAVFSKQIPEKERGRYSGIYSCSVNLDSIGIGRIFHAGDWRIDAILSYRCFANLNHVGFPKSSFNRE